MAHKGKGPKHPRADRATGLPNNFLVLVARIADSGPGDKDLCTGETLRADEHNTELAVAYEKGHERSASWLDNRLRDLARSTVEAEVKTCVPLDRHARTDGVSFSPLAGIAVGRCGTSHGQSWPSA